MTRISGRLAATLLLLFASVTAGIVSLGMAGAQDDDANSVSSSLPLFGTVADGTGYFQGTVSNLVASESDGTILLEGTVDGLVTSDIETVRVTGQELATVAEPAVVGAVSAEDDLGDDSDIDGTPAGNSTGNSLAFSSLQTDGASDCDVLYLQIESFTLDATGDEVEAAPIIFDANAVPATDTMLLCSLGEVLDQSPDDTTGIVDLLNQILGGVGGTTDDVTEDADVDPTEAVTDEDTEITEEATEEDSEATEEATEDTDVDPTEEDNDDKPVLSPIDDDDGTPED